MATEYNEYDSTIQSRDIRRKFLHTTYDVVAGKAYPILRFDGINKTEPAVIPRMYEALFNIRLRKTRDLALPHIGLDGATISYPNSNIWLDGDSDDPQFAVISSNPVRIYAKSLYLASTNEWRYRFGWYQNKLHLFFDRLKGSNTENILEVEIQMNATIEAARYYTIDNFVTMECFQYDVNNPKTFGIDLANIEFITHRAHPEQKQVQLRSDVFPVLNTAVPYTYPSSTEIQSYEYTEGNVPSTKYIDTRVAGNGTFTQKLDKVVTAAQGVKYAGLYADRPTSLVYDGFMYWATDLQTYFVKKGTGWDYIGGGGSGSPVYASESVAPLTSGTLTLKQATQTIINAALTNANTFTIALPSTVANVVNESVLIFKIGATLPSITLPANVTWRVQAPTWAINKGYTVAFERINFGGTWETWGTAIENA